MFVICAATFTSAQDSGVQRALPGAGLLLESAQDVGRNKIEFTGEQAISEQELRAAQAEEIRDILEKGVTPARADDLAFYIASYYRKAGFSQVAVDYEIHGDKVIIKIKEGARSTLHKLNFTGNHAVDDKTLYDYMIGATPERLAREPAKFPYTTAEISAGVDRVRGLYLSKGYLNVTIDASKVQLSGDGKQADVTVHITEGPVYPLPITVICELLGVPELDRAAFRKMSTEAVAPTSADSEYEAFTELAAYLDELIEDKRCAGPSDDLLSELLRTTAEDGDRLSAGELRGMAFLLLIAGHETTVNLIAGGVHNLLTHPDQLAALRADPGLVDGAVEEMLRHEGPVENATFRFAAEDLEIAGARMGKGDPVIIGLSSADRDAGRFPDPDRFDIHRDTQGHLAFGHGIHFCLGAPLARLEARTAIRSLLARAPGLTPDGPPGEWLPGTLIRGPRSLPVRW